MDGPSWAASSEGNQAVKAGSLWAVRPCFCQVLLGKLIRRRLRRLTWWIRSCDWRDQITRPARVCLSVVTRLSGFVRLNMDVRMIVAGMGMPNCCIAAWQSTRINEQ